MSNQKTYARLTGILLLVLAVVTSIAYFQLLNYYNPKNNSLSHSYFIYNRDYYMLISFYGVVFLNVLVSWTLYNFFAPIHKQLSIFGLICRLFYTLDLWFAVNHLRIDWSYANEFTLLYGFKLFCYFWSWGLIIFGIHILVIGVLMRKTPQIPSFLTYLMLFAGCCYCAINSLKIFLPNLQDITILLNDILVLPMAMGELGLAIWLLFKFKV